MAYPVLYLLLPFIGGIWVATCLPLPVSAWSICTGLALVLSWLGYSGQRFSLTGIFHCLLLSMFFLGAALASQKDLAYQQNPLHRLQFRDYLEVEGHLTRSPEQRSDRDLLYIRTDTLLFRNRSLSVHANIRITVPHSPLSSLPDDLLPGDRIRVGARLLRFPGFRNHRHFKPEQAYQVKLLHRLAYSKSAWLVQRISSRENWHPGRLVSKLRKNLLYRLRARFTSPSAPDLSAEGAVLEALLLGERSRLDAGTIRAFQGSGLYHLLAISGAHTAILIAALLWLLRRLRFNEVLSWILLLLLLYLFVVLVEGRPSVVRASLMAALYLTGKTFWRDTNPLNSLALAAFLLLFVRPLWMFDLGFQLTFVATSSILLFVPRIQRRIPRLPCRADSLFSVSLAAQLGVLPLSSRAFNRITYWPLLLNVLALPLVAGIMIYGYCFSMLCCILPGAADPAAFPLRILLKGLLVLAASAETLPFLSYRIPTPPAWAAGAFVLFLAGWLLPKPWARLRLFSHLGFVLSLGLLIVPRPQPSHQGMTVTFLDVGHGDAILVQLPGRENILIDGGGVREGDFDMGERVVCPYLWRKGIRLVDTLVMTHPHPDHYRGLQAVLRNFPVKRFWSSGAFFPLRKPPWLETLLPQDCSRQALFRGDRRVRNGVRIEVAHPVLAEYGEDADPNRYSLVLRLVYGQTALLLTADIDRIAEKEILAAGIYLRSGVLKSPHHGSRTSSSPAFLGAVNPNITVVSAGRGRTGLPSPQTLKRYTREGSLVYRTDLHGAVTVHSDGNVFSVSSVVPIPPLQDAVRRRAYLDPGRENPISENRQRKSGSPIPAHQMNQGKSGPGQRFCRWRW